MLETLPETLGKLESLWNLEIRDFPNLTSLPMSLDKLKCLSSLINGCANLKAFIDKSTYQNEPYKLLSISDREKLEILPETVGQLERLEVLEISGCPNLKVLPDCVGQLENLTSLTVVGCEKLETLPETLRKLEYLDILEIRDCPNLTSLLMSLGWRSWRRCLNRWDDSNL
ncbi:hypothetical protein R1flu_012769 [Riccia fluitans]|uniref:Uncharacterized protein n=1 Tax=Riccia fluitans TaxID=41844 RepID=A0ABD1ZFM5_9MARC